MSCKARLQPVHQELGIARGNEYGLLTMKRVPNRGKVAGNDRQAGADRVHNLQRAEAVFAVFVPWVEGQPETHPVEEILPFGAPNRAYETNPSLQAGVVLNLSTPCVDTQTVHIETADPKRRQIGLHPNAPEA